MYHPIWQHYTLTITCDPQTKQGQILVFDFYNWMAISVLYILLHTCPVPRLVKHMMMRELTSLRKQQLEHLITHVMSRYIRGLDALEVLPTARTLLLPGQMPPITSPFLEEKGNHVVSDSNLPNHRLLCSTRSFLPLLNLKEICYIYLLFADMFLEELKL